MGNTLPCPACGHHGNSVKNSRGNARQGHASVYRTRECLGCGKRFYTVEVVRRGNEVISWPLLDRIELLPDDKRAMMLELLEMIG